MASPHVAGAAALIRKVHPTWTVAEVKSALMTTALQTGFQENGTAPWTTDQVGSGRVDLTKAAKAGLTLDETYQRFLGANPSGGSLAVKDLNVPSVRNSNCQTTCSWTRTVKNQLATSGSWNATATAAGFGLTVSPASFTLAPGQTQELTITANLTGSLTAVAFGQVDLAETTGQSPNQHITAAVKGTGGSSGGSVDLKVDTFTSGGFNLLGSSTANPPLQFLWLNRFTPDAASYPFTLTSLETVYGSQTDNGSVGVEMGETFDYYVFQDSDSDPSNGATLVGKVEGVAVTKLDDLTTIAIPSPGITLNGPGDVLIAIVNRGRRGFYPASADMGPDQQRSWISGINVIGAGDPNLATINMTPITTALPTFTFNWIIRGHGATAQGKPVNLQ